MQPDVNSSLEAVHNQSNASNLHVALGCCQEVRTSFPTKSHVSKTKNVLSQFANSGRGRLRLSHVLITLSTVRLPLAPVGLEAALPEFLRMESPREKIFRAKVFVARKLYCSHLLIPLSAIRANPQAWPCSPSLFPPRHQPSPRSCFETSLETQALQSKGVRRSLKARCSSYQRSCTACELFPTKGRALPVPCSARRFSRERTYSSWSADSSQKAGQDTAEEALPRVVQPKGHDTARVHDKLKLALHNDTARYGQTRSEQLHLGSDSVSVQSDPLCNCLIVALIAMALTFT